MINSTLFIRIQELYIQCCPAEKTTDLRVRKLNSSIFSAIFAMLQASSTKSTKPHFVFELNFLLYRFRCLKICCIRFLLTWSFGVHMFIYSYIQWGLHTYVWLITRGDVFNYNGKLVGQKPGSLSVSLRKRAFLCNKLRKSCWCTFWVPALWWRSCEGNRASVVEASYGYAPKSGTSHPENWMEPETGLELQELFPSPKCCQNRLAS